MSISTYVRNTWVNGGSPAISATNLNKIDAQVDSLSKEFTDELIRPATTKTTIVDADEIQGNDSATSPTAFKWKKWTWATVKAWIKTFATPYPVSDISRVCHITGDGVPEIPDGTAVYRNTLTWSDWSAQTSTLSVSSGVLRATATGNNYGIQNAKACSAGNSILFRIKSSKSGTFSVVGTVNSAGNSILKAFLVNAGEITTVSFIAASLTTSIDYTIFNTGVAGDTIDFYAIYIGTGAYTTPVFDRASQYNFANTAVLPVASPDGKGLLFNGTSSFLQASSPVLGTTGSIFFEANISRLTGDERYFTNYNASARNGVSLVRSGTSLLFQIAYATGVETLTIATLPATGVYTLSVTFNSSRVYVFNLNGVVTQQTAINAQTASATNLHIGRSSSGATDFVLGDIYAFRYDSRIWTADEMARIAIDPSDVDSQVKSVTASPDSLVARNSSGHIEDATLPVYADNASAITGGLTAGQPYRTSTGVMMVRY